VISVDTNILVYAHRTDAPFHDIAARRLRALAEGRAVWAIAWPCLHEFLAVVTHPRIFDPPTPLTIALDTVEQWLEAPSLALLGETELHWPELRRLVVTAKVSGPRVHDARVAAICRQHGVSELWSVDRDFARFPELKVVNPLV
jgi:toxin-antitoxin system PIN domain toxin